MLSSGVAMTLVNIRVVPGGSGHALCNATFSVIEFSM
jgi:hypothetical protein